MEGVCVFNRIEQLRKFKLLNLHKKSEIIADEIVLLIVFFIFEQRYNLYQYDPPPFLGVFSIHRKKPYF
jgi:hypothetical protein